MTQQFKYSVSINNEVVFTTDSPTILFFYSSMRDFNELTHDDALIASDLAFNLYIKDNNATPIGHLSDFVGKHWRKLLEISYFDALDIFYKNYDSEDYSTVNDYTDEELIIEKEFYISVELKFDHLITAENKEEAIQIVKDTMLQDYGIHVEDSEIIAVEGGEE